MEWLEFAKTLIAWFAMILGCFFILSGSIGAIRMPNFFTRIHTASLADSLGAPLVIFAFIMISDDFLVIAKLVLLMMFLLLTGPTASHALAKSAIMQKDEKKS